MNVDEPAISVVVPTRDRPAALQRCLDAIDAMVGPSFEVLVVDDASADADTVASVVASSHRARLLRGGGYGPAAARNLGAAQARGRYLCFTDDDCRPAPGWLDALHARFVDGAPVVAGPTVNADPTDVYAAASQTITNSLLDASRDRVAGTVGFAPTSNLACTAELWEAAPFDENYPLAAGEDRNWCARVADRGVAIVYEPRACVVHAPELSLPRFWRQHVRYGRGAYRYHRSRDVARPVPGRFHLDLVRAGFTQGPRVGALVLLAQAATALGMLQESSAARADRRPH